MIRADLVRFLGGAVVGAVVVAVVGVSFPPRQAVPGQGPAADVGATDVPGIALPTLPATQTLQLVSYVEATGEQATGEPQSSAARAPWWNAGVPRVPAITQFDGGPLANVNCSMAAGAMLARLTFGVVTTGSQMRALQDDQEGGTSLRDVQAAVSRGWGVRFSSGALSPLQLRALIYAGAGAEIAGLYGEIPVGLRLQRDFTGGHAIYLDGFREAGPEGPAAYYVIDPIGRPWRGYRGGWWPADIVEHFGTVFGSGRVLAIWGFAGGSTPRKHPVLPRSAYPSTGPSVTPSPGASSVPTSGPSPGAGEDPMPVGDTAVLDDVDAGTTPPSSPENPVGEATTSSTAFAALLARCAVVPSPSDCPPGLVGRAVVPTSAVPSGSIAAPSPVRLLYVSQVGPGTWQIVFESALDTSPKIWMWSGGAGGTVKSGTVELAVLDGEPVGVATLVADPVQSFTFVITTTEGGHRSTSQLGSVTVP